MEFDFTFKAESVCQNLGLDTSDDSDRILADFVLDGILRTNSESETNRESTFMHSHIWSVTQPGQDEVLAAFIVKEFPNSDSVEIQLKGSILFAAGLNDPAFITSLSAFVFKLFPGHNQRLTIRHGEGKMPSSLKMAGFAYDEEHRNGKFDHFHKKMFELPNFLIQEQDELHVIAHDAGGAYQIAAMTKSLSIPISATLSGPALNIFASRNPHIRMKPISSVADSNQIILFGTGFYGGFESVAFENPALKNNFKVVLLDHWMNFSERFAPTKDFLPDLFLVTNSVAYEIAVRNFSSSSVVQIPDFLLSEYRRKYLMSEHIPTSILLILEPEPTKGEGLNFPIGNLSKYLSLVVDYAKSLNVKELVIRKHPSQTVYPTDEIAGSLSDIKVTYSESPELIEDLLQAQAVFGFHSYALYASSMLGINTFSFFADRTTHWTTYFPEIMTPYKS